MRKQTARERRAFKGYTQTVRNEAKTLENMGKGCGIHANFTCPITASQTAEKVEKVVNLIKKKDIIINNLGFGCQNEKNQTYEPFFIAGVLKNAKKRFRIFSYGLTPNELRIALNQRKIVVPLRDLYSPRILDILDNKIIRSKLVGGTILSGAIPKNVLSKIKFNQLDLITETPAKQADITTLHGIPSLGSTPLFTSKGSMTLLKNAVDSTKTGGYIITNPLRDKPLFTFTPDIDNEEIICKRYRLKKIDDGIYQKK